MKQYRIWTGYRNAGGGIDSTNNGSFWRYAESAQEAADDMAEDLEPGLIVVATDDDGESAESSND